MTRSTLVLQIIFFLRATAAYAGGNDLDLSLARDPEQQHRRLTEEEFYELSRDLAIVGTGPAFARFSPLGPLGLDIGASWGLIEIGQASSYWTKSTVDNHAPEVYWMGRANGRLGLPGNFDFGLSYGAAQNSNFSSAGGDLRYSIIPGSYLSSSIGMRAGLVKIYGIGGLDFTEVLFEIGFCKDYSDLSIIVGLTEIYAISRPNNLPLRDPDAPADAEIKYHKPLEGVVARGYLAGSHRIAGDFWAWFELGVGRVYGATLAIKYHNPRQ